VTHPYDPDAPRTEDSTGSNNDSERTHEEPPADTEATSSDDPSQRPVYERYDPAPGQEPPPYDPRPWDSMEDPAWPRRPEPEPAPPVREEYHGWNPLIRLGVPQPWRGIIDWIVTIVGAVAIVLAIKAWVVNPYRIPSSSMEPTLHCARPGAGCESRLSDRVLANRFIYHFRNPRRGEIIVFNTPTAAAEAACNASGTFVKRLIGLPGETVNERNGTLFIDGKKLDEPYIQPARRDHRSGTWHVPAGHYFFMGDNRIQSCDSRAWGSVARSALIGKVFMTYWPPNRISFHYLGEGLALGLFLYVPLRRRRRSGLR
jgi:signal peptidase I